MARQNCDYCGEYVGDFSHVRRLDGPLSCGEMECDRDARDDDRQDELEIRERAEQDDYGRYR